MKYGVKGATLQVEDAEVNAETLNIKFYQPRQKHRRGSAKAKCVFI